ncbi:MAG: endo alpha-1,4 polygalactosaminidase [Gammaproteobacteria bacterium]|nr:endo alpha-1,4 polygalactosaminidase [Gammaproteobacteria bacterium]
MSYPQSFGYVLQADAVSTSRTQAVSLLAASGRALLILDRSYSAGVAGAWSRVELERIRAGMPGRRVVAYFSIGEAERYRDYWGPEWNIGRPGFVLEENPNWPGNYLVEYWHPDWQSIVLSDLEKIVEQGFDGVYLDIVDGFSNFERDPDGSYHDDRVNPATGQSFRRDMVDLVAAIARHARAQVPDFWVIPQNGSQLLAFDDHVQTIDAIGVEDLYTRGDELQPVEHFAYVNGFLDRLRAAGKPVLLVEYAEDGALRARAVRAATARKDVLLLTDRPLKTLGRSYAPLHFQAAESGDAARPRTGLAVARQP